MNKGLNPAPKSIHAEEQGSGIAALGRELGMESTLCSFGKFFQLPAPGSSQAMDGRWGQGWTEALGAAPKARKALLSLAQSLRREGESLGQVWNPWGRIKTENKLKSLDPDPDCAAARSHGIKPEGFPCSMKNSSRAAWDETEICIIASPLQPKCEALKFQGFQVEFGIPSLWFPH
ncbi:hypothetical protein DUI87_04763 [Hirundo rustica rustica]|uniref:Uncharacterized protein n=1 Tax=Hirundo rustica rustica TaxID=333673 RepID=A0A3M0LII1_HIRRU|nr:hypothetical protein DUI87_04763 [Hirundo rustica rustica]